MEFSLPPLSRSEANHPAVTGSVPAIFVNSATPDPNQLHSNPAFRAHLARLKSIREKVMLQTSESIISFDYRQPSAATSATQYTAPYTAPAIESVITPATGPTAVHAYSSSLPEKEQLEVAEIFLSKLERLISENNQHRNQSQ